MKLAGYFVVDFLDFLQIMRSLFDLILLELDESNLVEHPRLMHVLFHGGEGTN